MNQRQLRSVSQLQPLHPETKQNLYLFPARPLSSWKEIAAYVGKGVRTVQRWEAEQGFPVMRPTADRHIVMAMPAEIDAWIVKNYECASNGEGDLEEELAQARAEIMELRSQVATLLARLEALDKKNGGTLP